jgi:chromosome segregation ATPase
MTDPSLTDSPDPTRSLPETFDALAAEREIFQEMLREMRRRFTQEKAHWQGLLGRRDAMVASLKAEKERLESELKRLRQDHADLRLDLEHHLEFQSLERSEKEAELVRQIQKHQSELSFFEQQIRDREASHAQEAQRYESRVKRWREEEKNWQKLLEKKDEEILQLKFRFNELEVQRQKDLAAQIDEKGRAEASLRDERLRAEKENQSLAKELETQRAETKNLQALLESARQNIV